MTNTAHTQLLQNRVPRRLQQPEVVTTVRGVWQDKTAPQRVRAASPQPAPQKNMTRTRQTDTKISRSQKHSNKRKTVQLNVWVRPQLKAEIERIAKLEGLSVSQTGGAALEEWVRQQLHTQHAVLLQPIIETTIRKEISKIITRQVLFQVRVAFEAGQSRRILTNILKLQNGMTNEKLFEIIDASAKETRKHLFRRTPEMVSLIQEVEAWFREENT